MRRRQPSAVTPSNATTSTIRNNTRKMPNRSFDTLAAPAATLVKPSTPATMAINAKQDLTRSDGHEGAEERLGLRLSKAVLEGLAAWARAERRSTAGQGRVLIEQAVTARLDRLALTRR